MRDKDEILWPEQDSAVGIAALIVLVLIIAVLVAI